MTVAIDGSNGLTFPNSSTQAQSAGMGTSATAQTWQNVGASRALGTTYTNSTGYPIMVAVSCTGNGGFIQAYFTVQVNGVTIATQGANSGSAGGAAYPCVTWIVPNGATYAATNSNGCTLSSWFELR